MIMYCFHNNSPIHYTIIKYLQRIDLKFAFRSMIDRSGFDRSDRSCSRIVWPLLDGRTNAWNDNNTHRHQCWPRLSHLETSAFLTLCHSFPVTCQQMCKNLKMWLTDLLTDKRTDRWTDKRVAGGHYCWGVLLWPPQLGLGGKCDKKWKFKNVEKITSFSDAVTLTFDLRPWKVNQVRTLSLPMCIPNLRTIHPMVFELSR